ncbi:MAG TPA: hypothetical protein VEK11_18665 [Thermoanaerobaculia bacterium]|nr:hypothetical protein [Thermoanaerobaculia bacterium]
MNCKRTFLLLASLTLTFAANAAMTFRVVSTTALPEGVIARDVRWASDTEVFVGTGKRGVVRTRVDSTAHPHLVVAGAERGGGPTVIAGRLGLAQNHILFASGMGMVGWSPLAGTTRKVEQKGLVALMDVDARGDTAAILGADSGPVQGLQREGTILWIGSLSKNLANLRPIMKGRSKPGGKDMARCSILETGALRYMPDGSLVVIPGVEPGVYRYDANGKLMQTWDTDPLGIVDDCWIPESDLLLVARDFGERIKWYASRVTLDEILPTANGPAVVLRRVEKGVTKWDLVTLPYKGRSERIALPVTMPTPRAHVRGDIRGNRLVLLMWDDPMPGQKAAAPPKLIVMSIDGK